MNILSLITPINLETEKVKFLASTAYHPIFEYQWEEKHLHNDAEDPLKSQLYQAVIAQDNLLIMDIAQAYFQVDLETDKDEADRLLVMKFEKVEEFDLKMLINAYRDAMKFFAIDYEILVNDDPGYGIRPQNKLRQLHISRSYKYQFMDLKNSVKHEMVHLIRYENGKLNKIKRTADYLPTEEGLATYVQDYTPTTNVSVFQHAAEYLGSITGTRGSLRDIFNQFISLGFDPQLAWQRAARHKFGFKDTRSPGDIMKPAMYFNHAQKIKRLTLDEKLRLFSGKIGVSALTDIKKYSGICSKEQLIDYFELK